MKTKRSILLIVLMLLLASCGSQSKESEKAGFDKSKPIKVGIVPGSTSGDLLTFTKDLLEKDGYTIEISNYNDFNAPNTALSEGSIDFNFYQHVPFLEAFNESNGTDMVPVGKGVYDIAYGVFSDKVKKVEEVTDGMTVAIQNDSSNRRNSLLMLEKIGLIKLKEGVEIPTLLDIAENSKNLKFIEMEETLIAGAMKDVDIGCLGVGRWVDSGRDPDEALWIEVQKESTLTLVTKKGNENSEAANVLQNALTSPEAKKFLEENFKGIAYPVQ